LIGDPKPFIALRQACLGSGLGTQGKTAEANGKVAQWINKERVLKTITLPRDFIMED
jgi:hypothetical protein